MRTLSAPHFLAVAFVAVGVMACRSAAPDLAPSTPTTPLISEVAAESPDVDASTSVGTAPPMEDVVEAGLDMDGDAFLGEDEGEGGPDALQKQALELCQAAEQLIEQGDIDEAMTSVDRAYELMLQLPSNGDDSYLQAREDIRRLVADLISRAYPTGGGARTHVTSSWDLALPIVDNDHVHREIQSFTTVEREHFIEAYRRSGLYRPMILARLEEAGLPSQLSWLPMVESWFKVRAYSRASAVGLWQFISSTGLRYGLGRDAWVDERFDPEKSTDAAIGYLTDLHGLFGDWPKALAAYNCGEARVQRLQRRSADEYLDFWDLYEMLPRETRRYVPRLIAALQIIENPEKYGMELPDPVTPIDVVTVDVEKQVKLDSLDETLGLEEGTLALLNPELRYKGTPHRTYALKVPAGQETVVRASIDSLPEWKPPQTQYVTHRVRRGESLSVIAGRYGSSVGSIMRVNGLRSANRIWPGQRLRIPVRGSGGAVRHVSRTAVNGMHTVRRGESLGAIASAYGTTVSRLKADNGLSSDVIYPGQELRVGGSSGSEGVTTAGSSHYTVRRGDTLGKIASRHGVSLSALLSANGLGSRSTIYPGQTLVIP